MKTYEFTYRLRGRGTDEEEALNNALEAFHADPGEPASFTLLEDDELIQSILVEKYKCFSYSGRGMGGRRCLALSTNDSWGTVIALLISHCDINNNDQIAAAVRGMASDRLGMEMVYYFPSIEYVEQFPPIPEDCEDE